MKRNDGFRRREGAKKIDMRTGMKRSRRGPSQNKHGRSTSQLIGRYSLRLLCMVDFI